MIRYRRAKALLVVSSEEGRILGKLDDFQFDLDTRAIYGFRVREPGVFGKVGGVAASQVTRLGQDVAFVAREADVEWVPATRQAEEGRAWASQYRAARVMSRSGRDLGTVEDFVFTRDADRVVGLVLNDERLVDLDEHVATGPAAVILDDPQQVRELPATQRGGERDWRTRLRRRRGED